jgi:excisionase family DNA binding protein
VAKTTLLPIEPSRSQVRQPAAGVRLLRTRDAARYLGLGEKAVRQLILEGELDFVQLRPGNSPFLLDVRDLDRFIESRKNCRLRS